MKAILLLSKPGNASTLRATKIGFSFGGFIFGKFWLLFHGLWFHFLLFLSLEIAMHYFLLDNLTELIIYQLAARALIAFSEPSWFEDKLRRQGFVPRHLFLSKNGIPAIIHLD